MTMTTTTEGTTMTDTTTSWTAPAEPAPAPTGVVLTFTRGSGQTVTLTLALSDLHHLLDAAAPTVARHRAMSNAATAGTWERSASAAIVKAYQRVRDAASDAELAL